LTERDSQLFYRGPEVREAAIILAEADMGTVDAILLMIDRAHNTGRTVNDVARNIVERGLRLESRLEVWTGDGH
jgi:hypothetical protein